MMSGNQTHVVIANGGSKHLVVVRYYLDRAGYDLHNSSSRFWKDPPAVATPGDIADFLDQQSIKRKDDAKMLVEVFLDKFGSFMLLEVCAANNVSFDFGSAIPENPGILNIRLTDLSELTTQQNATTATAAAAGNHRQHCNTSPVGLFAFSMTVALDSLNLLRKLVEGSVDASFWLTWGPYAFFVSGLLQFVVGLNEITRNNVWGATAFLAFGCFWMANGLKIILLTYFSDGIDVKYLPASGTITNGADTFVREFMIMIFAFVLLKQTFIMNKLTTGMISTLIAYLFAASLGGWYEAAEWIKMILGFVLALYALFLFYAELTNEVYHREVVCLYPWNVNSTIEAFGAAGRTNTLQTKAVDLRTAGLANLLALEDTDKNSNFPTVGNTPAASKFELRAVRPGDAVANGKQS
jgi:uncharacterized protein